MGKNVTYQLIRTMHKQIHLAGNKNRSDIVLTVTNFERQ